MSPEFWTQLNAFRRTYGLAPVNEQTYTYQRYPFTPAEFERLWNYRLAIQAGYYTDELRKTSG